MRLDPLLHRWADEPAFTDLLDRLASSALPGGPAARVVVPDAARPFLLAGLAHATDRLVVAVTPTVADAEALTADVDAFLGAGAAAVFPPWETLPHERLSPRSETVARRLSTLHRAVRAVPGRTGAPAATVESSWDASGGTGGPAPQGPAPEAPLRLMAVPGRALMQPLAPGLTAVRPVRVAKGDELALDDLLGALVDAGYRRVDMVERRGEVAVRGGLVDCFPPGADHPVRIEFWGDEVESVRAFAVASQRSLTELGSVTAFPCREVRLTPETRARARQLAGEFPAVEDLLTQVAEGQDPEGLEALLPLLFDELPGLLDELPDSAVVVVVDPRRTLDRADEVRAQADEALQASWVNASQGGRSPVEGAAYQPLTEVLARAKQPLVEAGALVGGLDGHQDEAAPGGGPVGTGGMELGGAVSGRRGGTDAVGTGAAVFGSAGSTGVGPATGAGDLLTVDAQPLVPYRADMARIAADARELAAAGSTVLLLTEGPGPAQRLVEALRDEDLHVSLTTDVAADARAGVLVGTAPLLHGFRLPRARLVLVGEGDLYGTRRQTVDAARTSTPTPNRRRSRGGQPAGPAVRADELEPGDIVVHNVHGIGRYVGMEHRTAGGVERDYLLLEYDQRARLYLPSEQVEMITRYVGGDAPKLSKLGTKEWERQKAKVRKKVREMAGELVRLYSARMAEPGHAFGPDQPWQQELEDAFPYVETPDQLRAVEEIKGDMESPVPMDRLLCADVGFGKTEVALRAAFKAVMDGKQVAFLVPTTLLAQQHLASVRERFAPFPVKVAGMSRFQNRAEQQEVADGLARGDVDVVVGTHRLLSKDISWSDLGLVVIDEEHRFGVTHKEHMKQLRTQVDVLSLTATPIPRTLELSLSGIRDLSVMTTPPEERHPVLTFVGPHDDQQVANAIRREMVREGQTFYVHNRVDTIPRVASRLRELVPEARIGVAHGQMGEDELERVMFGFWDKEYDVLLCTTIIESGIDVPTANTLIVDRADRMGLAQLHQLRGRVGRARERGYAYLMYPAERSVTENSHERLSTIATHTDLGSGMAIAMRDLEIRGAGNLLGGDQSGHVALVGYDMYMSMLGDAVAEMRSGKAPDSPAGLAGRPGEVRLEVPADAHVPASYVPRERLRLEIYRRVGGTRTVEEVVALAAELRDRYGPPPEPVRSLLVLAGVRAQAAAVDLTDVVCFAGKVRLAPVDEIADSRQVRLSRLYRGALHKPADRSLLVPLPKGAADLPAWLADLLSGILGAPEVPVLDLSSHDVPSV